MLTLTRNTIKEIRALEQRKGRREQHAWLAEGNKLVGDLLATREALPYHCQRLVATDEWWQLHPEYATLATECYLATRADLERTSLLQTPQDVLAVFSLPSYNESGDMNTHAKVSRQLCILLDEVQDPGNLGTIIRTADWYGVRHIYCSPGTADCYSPKVVQATMSALARVRLHYFESREDVCQWLRNAGTAVYGTFLDGSDIYHTELHSEGILVMGNEGRGISDEVAQLVTDRLLIPHFSPDGAHVESLNVSIATAICLSEIRRR